MNRQARLLRPKERVETLPVQRCAVRFVRVGMAGGVSRGLRLQKGREGTSDRCIPHLHAVGGGFFSPLMKSSGPLTTASSRHPDWRLRGSILKH